VTETPESTELATLPRAGASAAAEYGRRAYRYLSEAVAFEVDSPQMAEMAAADLQRIKAFAKEVDDERKSITRKLDEVKSGIMAMFRPAGDYLAEAESALKGSLTKFLDAEEKKRREEEAIKRKAAEEAAARMREEAAVLASQGDADTARALGQQADMLPAMVEADTRTTKLHGVSSAERWQFEIVDSAKIPRDYLMVDEAKIRKVVQALKAETAIPGIRVYATRQISARAG
jgi:hypothetical protein